LQAFNFSGLIPMFLFRQIEIPGCYEITRSVVNDHRGSFVKIYNKFDFVENMIPCDFVEIFYTKSITGVIRGLHFQLPPNDHAKLVHCIDGEIFDVLVDIRRGSPVYGKPFSLKLFSGTGKSIYIPPGVAHGFCSMTQTATVSYSLTTSYAPISDTGILWSSFGINWPVKIPIVSARDAAFVPFREFKSPFEYHNL
jgi:dTDP-4-dehydrorhamnose 3,5-epimerase